MMMKKKKIYNTFLKAAKDMLSDVPDSELSTVAGIQETMNKFLETQGLPPVGLPGVGVLDRQPDRRSYEEIENELSDLFNFDDDP